MSDNSAQALGRRQSPLETLMRATEVAFAEIGVEVAVSEEMIALTASADGAAAWAILLVGPAAFQAHFAKLFAGDAYAAAKKLVQRLRESGSGDLRVSDGIVYAVIEPDLPDGAILRLGEPLPPAPSGELRYDRVRGAWRDSEADTPPEASVGPERFREVMAPTVDVVRELTSALFGVADRHGDQPWVPSVAVAEIAEEVTRLGKLTNWDGPIRDSHSLGGISLLAACDYVRCFGDAFDASRTPVFGHLVLARSALQACVISAWLNDPTITPDERAERGLWEQLYSAMELERLDLEDNAAERVQRLEVVAAGFGWTVTKSRGKPAIDGVTRPVIATGIDELVLGDGVWRLGRAQWSYLSAVDHVTWWGLRQAILDPPSEPDASGRSLAGIGTKSSSVCAQAICVLKALRKAGAVRLVLMGWTDREWEEACRRSEAHETVLVRAFTPPQL